jgi:zinc/manganese transport system substrate-binding protein
MTRVETARTLTRLLLLPLVVAALMQPVAATARESVVTTLPSLASIVREIGGDRVEVVALCRGYEDPHYIQAKPSYAKSLRKAILLVYDGLELEVGWLPPLLETARNPKIAPGAPGLLEASTAVQRVLEVPSGELSRAQGDIHPFGNPHFMLDPRNALAVTDLIAERLGELDPEGSDAYLAGAASYRQRLEAKIDEWETLATAIRGKSIVAYHKQWEYLADWLGLKIVGYIEGKPGIPPAPRHVASIIEMVRSDHIEMVVAATFMDTAAAEKVAQSGDARLVVLPAEVGGVEGTDTYFDFMDAVVRKLVGQ